MFEYLEDVETDRDVEELISYTNDLINTPMCRPCMNCGRSFGSQFLFVLHFETGECE